jgi:hypothetical protein
VVYKEQKLTKELLEQFHGNLILLRNWRTRVKRKQIKSGPAKQWMEGKDFRLAKEIRYIQRQAAEHAGIRLQSCRRTLSLDAVGLAFFFLTSSKELTRDQGAWDELVANNSGLFL